MSRLSFKDFAIVILFGSCGSFRSLSWYTPDVTHRNDIFSEVINYDLMNMFYGIDQTQAYNSSL